jgi:hypothetical protein
LGSPYLSPFGRIGLGTDEGLIVFSPFDPAVDIQIDRCQIPIAFLLPSDLNAFRTVFMVKEIHPLSDEVDGGFKKVSIQGKGPVFSHPSPGNDAKMIS